MSGCVHIVQSQPEWAVLHPTQHPDRYVVLCDGYAFMLVSSCVHILQSQPEWAILYPASEPLRGAVWCIFMYANERLCAYITEPTWVSCTSPSVRTATWCCLAVSHWQTSSTASCRVYRDTHFTCALTTLSTWPVMSLFTRTPVQSPLNWLLDLIALIMICFQCFDAVGWAAGRASGW